MPPRRSRLSGAPSSFHRPTPICVPSLIARTPGRPSQPGQSTTGVDHHHALARLAHQVGEAVAGHVADRGEACRPRRSPGASTRRAAGARGRRRATAPGCPVPRLAGDHVAVAVAVPVADAEDPVGAGEAHAGVDRRPRSNVPGLTQALTVVPTSARTSGARLPGHVSDRGSAAAVEPGERAEPVAEGAVAATGQDVGVAGGRARARTGRGCPSRVKSPPPVTVA